MPGLRGLLGIAPLGPADVAVTLGAGVLPYSVNSALRRRYGSDQRGHRHPD
ncbi:hypothetical protein GCM10011504_58530 [Siccirubricoccus deserti]|uniref:Uncharacterized protein n=1 Tax=Siccirubricoccus deserti TaxID=2013562 RepID=A0A9X0UFW3_9PROT|nr:hypothetical protein [Siccirubricoccus deserti]MBC4019329.1 hypothetical protein [Siccirubricoccus deserti]GGC73472.1 hypothetical protein GCM10011504_58530 [Siccirubricoccus deserti]